MVFVTVVLILGFYTLSQNQKKLFDNAKSAFVLNKDLNVNSLIDALVYGNYISDRKDANLIAEHIKNKLANGAELPNLGELNKKTFYLPAETAYNEGGSRLKQRVERSRENLGLNEETEEKYNENLPVILDLRTGTCEIKVKVQQIDNTANRLKKLLGKNYKPDTSTVLVQLKEHYYTVVGEDSIASDSIAGYAMTNKNGIAIFDNLNKGGFYSVLPIKDGFEYGGSKGTLKGSLKINREFTFTQSEHQITPFDALAYSQIKEDNALTVRTPEGYKNDMITYFILFLLTWWAFHFYQSLRNRKRKIVTDNLLIPVLMTLSGFCLLTMYAIINPLTDIMIGNKMAKAAIIGILLIGFMSEINFVNFYENYFKIKFDFVLQFFSWIITPFIRLFTPIKKNQKSKLFGGFGYVIAALGLLALLYLFGSGPAGSGAKVNLFGFQPSEISKYLIVFFFSAFFCNNAKKIQAFSGEFNSTSFRLQLRTVFVALIAMVLIFGIYLGVLSDGGPALVISIAFILIYSVARRDLWQLLFGVISFIVFLVAGWQLNHTMPTLGIFALLWLTVWLAFWYFKKKRLYESAIFMNLLIALFIFGGPVCNWIGLNAEGQRLNDRNTVIVWSYNESNTNRKDNGIWDNEVKGGDQVVNGIWALASGGFSGQGLGKGNPNLIPASNTDMAFISIGEELGFAALILIILCMAILLHRSLLLARRAGNPFAFFLITGITVVTGVQFLIIVLGSIGLLPLTGVAVPFLSYGGSSMFINLAAFGIVLSLSRERATENQAKEIKKYDNIIVAGIVTYIGISLILLGTLFNYMIVSRDRSLTKYATTNSSQGARIIEYNPRINLLMKKLYSGNIYDRNHLLLATSDKELLKGATADSIIEAGIDKNALNNELKKRQIRYYPFGSHLFFMLGDFNSKVQWSINDNNPYGYMAENRYLASLRGFDNTVDKKRNKLDTLRLKTERYYPNSFLSSKDTVFDYHLYNYDTIVPMLKAGTDSREVVKWNEKRDKERNITLTIDASLQTKMQNEIEKYVTNNFKGPVWNKLRISVVVLNAQCGDLLCSANYPLPNQDTLRYSPNVYSERDRNSKAYTDRDLGLTFQTAPGSTAKVMSALAGFKKLGKEVVNIKYRIDALETVEPPKDEPNFQRDGHKTTMEEAIKLSSNCYFINLVNANDLYLQLDSIYQAVGIRIDKEGTDKKGGTIVEKTLTPYFLDYDISASRREQFNQEVASMQRKGIATYTNYITKRNEGLRNPKITDKSILFRRMIWNECGWAWGQGTMRATPLNMARAAGIVANAGTFVETRFIKEGNKNLKIEKCDTISIVSQDAANILKGYMQNETQKWIDKGYNFPKGIMGGKTGTPERGLLFYRNVMDKTGKNIVVKDPPQKHNDGWYIFFVWSEKEKAYLSVAVRMERLLSGDTSGAAVRLADKVIINKVLRELKYII